MTYWRPVDTAPHDRPLLLARPGKGGPGYWNVVIGKWRQPLFGKAGWHSASGNPFDGVTLWAEVPYPEGD